MPEAPSTPAPAADGASAVAVAVVSPTVIAAQRPAARPAARRGLEKVRVVTQGT
jgi:hypothetical protein